MRQFVRLLLAGPLLWGLGDAATAGQVYVLHLESGEITRVSQDIGREFGSPSWSPDGQWIACDSWPIGRALQDSEIGVLPSGGGELRTFGPGAMPSWAPDGSQFVCHTYNTGRNRSPQIVVVNADGSGREAILESWGCPRWMPDGKSIVTIFNGGLARYDLATGKQSMLTSNLMIRPGFAYSEKKNAFCAPTQSQSLYLIQPDEATGGWRERSLMNAATRVGHASWSPDGQRIVFGLGTIENYCRLCFIVTDGKSPPVHVPGIPANWICCNPSWSPDGQRIVFIRIDMDVEATEFGDPPVSRRLLPRFGVRSLLVITAFCAVLMATWAQIVRPYAAQAAAVGWLRKLQAEVVLQKASGDRWSDPLVRLMLGPDSIFEATEARLPATNLPDDAAGRLAALPYLESFDADRSLPGNEVAHGLRTAERLGYLSLRYTQLTDEGLKKLSGLPRLATLRLTGNAGVTDEGLALLAKCPSLKEVYVRWTGVTEQGAERLRQALPGCRVHTGHLSAPSDGETVGMAGS